jgi:hypothetical protein
MGMQVVRVHIPGDALIASAQKTFGVMRRSGAAISNFLLPLPGALGSVRRDQNPLTFEWIESAMGVINRIKHEEALSLGNVLFEHIQTAQFMDF